MTFFEPLKSANKHILIIIGILGALSLLMLESTVYDGGFVLDRVLIVQMISYVLGFILLVTVLHFDHTVFINFDKFLYAASILLLLSVYIPGLGQERYGSRAWINLGVTTLQPSEFAKILFVLIMASYLSKHREDIKKFRGVLLAGIYAAPHILLVLKEDLGSALVFMVMWVFMVFFAGIDYKILLKSIVAVIAMIPIVYSLLDDYQKDRIEAFLHPDNLDLPGNYQVWESKIAIGSGNIWGKGLFQGTQKELDFIPVQQSDFIFSVFVEELGFVGGAVIIILYGCLLYRLASVIQDAVDLNGALIAVGFTSMFLFQIFENIAMTMGLMPVTGITLPFLSGGGTSVMASMISVGFVLNIGINSKLIRF